MIAKLGIYSLLAGFFLGIFSGISSFMEAKNFWVDLTISRIVKEESCEAFIGLTDIAFIQNLLDFLIYELPIFAFLLGLGLIFLLISLFEKSH